MQACRGESSDNRGDTMEEKNVLQTFKRSRRDRWLGGICGALGSRTPAPSWAWRLLFVLLFLAYGTGLLFYVLLWIFVPQEPETPA
jgi:phage shock protein PspC (stress-responsive transcriptional regulator)